MSNKKIGILTLQNSNNYGAMYQCYALSKYLENEGYEVFLLDYEMTRDSAGIVDYLRHPLSFIMKLIYKKELLVNKFKKAKHLASFVDRKDRYTEIFNEFRADQLKILNKKYNYQSLLKSCPKADVYICGSDQVWAADFLFTSPAFLLGFVPKSTKKVTYAASFGKNKLEPYLRSTFKKYANEIDAISVREKTGVGIVGSLTSQDATHVLDPTLLLDKRDYSEIIDYSLVPKEPFVFVYKLDKNKELSDWMDTCINSISARNNFSVLAVSTNLVHPFDEAWEELQPTPGQLLGLIEKSELTITNSFHGTVFSILLETKFLSFARDIYKDKQNVRMEEMLGNLGLEAFYCKPFLDVEQVFENLNKPYDYEKVFNKLNVMRRTSKDFLQNAIEF